VKSDTRIFRTELPPPDPRVQLRPTTLVGADGDRGNPRLGGTPVHPAVTGPVLDHDVAGGERDLVIVFELENDCWMSLPRRLNMSGLKPMDWISRSIHSSVVNPRRASRYCSTSNFDSWMG
jgi:hypothetical protein